MHVGTVCMSEGVHSVIHRAVEPSWVLGMHQSMPWSSYKLNSHCVAAMGSHSHNM